MQVDMLDILISLAKRQRSYKGNPDESFKLLQFSSAKNIFTQFVKSHDFKFRLALLVV